MPNTFRQLLEFGLFRIDPEQRLLLRDEQPIPLSPKAFDLLLALVQRSGQVVLKDDLMKLLWPDTFVEESNLGQHVFQLRKALGERAQDHAYIVTIPGRGYRFVQKVRALPLTTEEIVVQSHSRSRMVIEERFELQDREGDSGLSCPTTPALQDSPAAETRTADHQTKRHRGTMVGFVLLGTAIGAAVVWAFFRPLPRPKVVRTVQITHFGRAEPFGRALTDGPRIYFAERMGGTWSLAQVSEPGGDPALISSSVDRIALFDIDSKHSRLLVAAQGPNDASLDPLWILPTSGGSARRVGEVLAGDASWAPDGRSLVYCDRGNLSVVGDDGQNPRKLFSFNGLILYPRWSPDGKSVSFTVRDFATGILSLWEVGQDGANPHPLSLGWKTPASRYNEGECCGDWSPDGQYFVFRSMRDGLKGFWVIRKTENWFHRDVTAPVQLYTNPDWISEPRFSADGKKIFFVGSQQRRELVRYDVGRKLFVPYLGGLSARHLSFSRDGQWVSYKSEVDGTLWRIRVDGTQARQLTFPPLDVLHSSWSPDGKKIVFGASGDLYVVPFDGGNPERLTTGGQPSWSPDGKTILFVRWNTHGSAGSSPAIYQLDLSTGTASPIPGSDDFEGPQWSPDGRYMAASNKRDQKLMLFDFGRGDFSRGRWSELADGLPYGWGIRWSADSQFVYYQHVYSGEEQPIFRVRVRDRKVEQITSSRQIVRADVLSYAITGLTPDNAPLASLVHGNSDIYALELDLP